jgi:hypothetical protein
MIPVSDTIPLNDYCSLFGLTTMDDLIEINSEWVWECSVDAARDLTPDTTEWQDRVDSQSEELWSRINSVYNSSLESTFSYLSELGVTVSLGDDNSITFSSDNWEEAGKVVLESINGYGLFHFHDLEELVSSGPYAGVKEAVIAHLHWHKSRGEVYGETGIKRTFDKALERAFRYL